MDGEGEVEKGSWGGPLVGWDMRTRDLKMSGRERAQREAVTAPKSWPTMLVTLV